ncbi:DUF5988 family protein [Streptomyces sp. NBC_01803]|uniref:DUF5988 family protein n=1 Tax=Streptomyces sp. NBC_01803 TaxID=2975946 RepID=UPI002DDB9390|nr:DUF5988 family protein [Streptomyces sp. NBC_01803]WSA44523.1 DUF5988 family protein [Streptomyces sp. NBC_01803]
MQESDLVIIVGGPYEVPRVCPAPPEGQKTVKIQHGDGYEHFEPCEEYAEISGRQAAVYRWSRRTRIAE